MRLRVLTACSSKLPGSGSAAVDIALSRWGASMRQFRHISLMLAALIVCHTVGDGLWAKGHGGSKCGGKGNASHVSENVEEWTENSKDPRAVADREMRMELWKLKMRMEAVKRLRERAAATGNECLLKLADRLEKKALERFHQRMNQIAEYRRQHGLPDVNPHLAQ
jgi:hypothetical protein